MISFLLLTLLFLSCLVSIRLNGLVSIPTAMVIGGSVYTVPSIMGFYLAPSRYGVNFEGVSIMSTQVVFWAWLWIMLGLLLFSNLNLFRKSRRYYAPKSAKVLMIDRRSRLFCLICFFVSTALYIWISILDSPLFFLEDRLATNLSAEPQKMLWRWVNVYGLLSAVLVRSKILTGIFLTYQLMYFIAGDRTMVLISATAFAVYFFHAQRNILKLVRFDLVLLCVLLAVLLLFGKPIYLSIKSQSTLPLLLTFDAKSGSIIWSFFEPMITHTILEDVLRTGFSYSWEDLIRGTFGQLLIIPSAFGVDSSAFNAQLQEALYASLSYGVASNYIAQGWSLGGWSGVAVLMTILVFLCCGLSEISIRVSPLPRIMLVIAGATLSVYFYRNSLENILSMIRQIFLVGVPMLLLTQFLHSRKRHSL